MAVVAMNRPLVKAMLFAVILVIAFCLYTIVWLFIAISLSSPNGVESLIVPYVRMLTVPIVLGTVAFTYFAIGLLPIKLKRPGRSALAIAISWLGMNVSLNVLGADYGACAYYTQEMNGGVRVFQDKQYNISLCGTQPRINYKDHEGGEVRLQVFSMDGKLLAERYFEPWVSDDEHGMWIDYGENHLAYSESHKGSNTTMTMPPTRLDWIRARLPRLWPLR